MKTSSRVFVKRLPNKLGFPGVSDLWNELAPQLRMDNPKIVFDCADVRQIDSAGADLLLRCMEEVMKQDGDLKLASVSPEAAVILKLTRMDRVFEIFETVTDAIVSFMGVVDSVQIDGMPLSSPTPSPAIGSTPDLDLAG
jgi:anti-sigma B factor antagonist